MASSLEPWSTIQLKPHRVKTTTSVKIPRYFKPRPKVSKVANEPLAFTHRSTVSQHSTPPALLASMLMWPPNTDRNGTSYRSQ